MSARPQDPRDLPEAVRDDDPVRRGSQTGDGPPANPQAAEDRAGRPRPARERDLRFGLLPALLLSLVVHASAVEALGFLGFGDDAPPRLALRGTGARGEPGGDGDGDGVRITIRGGGRAWMGPQPGEGGAAMATEEVVVSAQGFEAATTNETEATSESRPMPMAAPAVVAQAPHEPTLVAQIERETVVAETAPLATTSTSAIVEPAREVTAVAAFAATPEAIAATSAPAQALEVVSTPVAPVDAMVAAASATHEPVATLGEWEGPPTPAGTVVASDAPSQGALIAALAALGGGDGTGVDGTGGRGHGAGLGQGDGAGPGDAEHGGGAGGGAGGGVGRGPGGHNGNGVMAPSPLTGNEPPDYPFEARRAGEEGLVLVHAKVGADGVVTEVSLRASCGFERLDQAALDAVAQWIFEPARKDGRAIAQDVDVPIRFHLQPR
jgi:TonB family protein